MHTLDLIILARASLVEEAVARPLKVKAAGFDCFCQSLLHGRETVDLLRSIARTTRPASVDTKSDQLSCNLDFGGRAKIN